MSFDQALSLIAAFYLEQSVYYQSFSDGQEDWPKNWNSQDYTNAYKRRTKDLYQSFDISLYDDTPKWHALYFVDRVWR